VRVRRRRAAPRQVDHSIPTVVGKFRDLVMTPVTMVKEAQRILKRLPDDSTRTVSILKDCKGALVPGTMTLLVAPPGHGKTCFLKALAGRLPQTGVHGRRVATWRARAQRRRKSDFSGLRACARAVRDAARRRCRAAARHAPGAAARTRAALPAQRATRLTRFSPPAAPPIPCAPAASRSAG
jgi:hypothetical protein